jgi:hypothetical protein
MMERKQMLESSKELRETDPGLTRILSAWLGANASVGGGLDLEIAFSRDCRLVGLRSRMDDPANDRCLREGDGRCR